MSELEGRVAVVTGGGRGIGEATVELLARRGAKVVTCARTADDVEEVVARVSALGGDAVGFSADLSSLEGVEAFVGAATEHLGRVDILVNNVGTSAPGRFASLTDDDWLRSLDVNLMSTIRTTTILRPAMTAAASIVNVASISGREPDHMVAPYAASKAALIAYSKAAADAFARAGIRVNCVLPGIIETSSTVRNTAASAASTGKTPEQVMDAMLERHPIPLGRLGRPAEVAELIAFLASDRADFITGSTYHIDGGAHRAA